MKVHFDVSDIYNKIKRPVVTVGTFDGVHLGHQKIIKRIRKIAKEIKGESVLLTFDPHPRSILFNDQHIKLMGIHQGPGMAPGSIGNNNRKST